MVRALPGVGEDRKGVVDRLPSAEEAVEVGDRGRRALVVRQASAEVVVGAAAAVVVADKARRAVRSNVLRGVKTSHVVLGGWSWRSNSTDFRSQAGGSFWR
jgi:hypothetical protein